MAAPTLSLIGLSKPFRSSARELKASETATGEWFGKTGLSPSDKRPRRIVNKSFENDLKRPSEFLDQVPMDGLSGGNEQ